MKRKKIDGKYGLCKSSNFPCEQYNSTVSKTYQSKQLHLFYETKYYTRIYENPERKSMTMCTSQQTININLL